MRFFRLAVCGSGALAAACHGNGYDLLHRNRDDLARFDVMRR